MTKKEEDYVQEIEKLRDENETLRQALLFEGQCVIWVTNMLIMIGFVLLTSFSCVCCLVVWFDSLFYYCDMTLMQALRPIAAQLLNESCAAIGWNVWVSVMSQ